MRGEAPRKAPTPDDRTAQATGRILVIPMLLLGAVGAGSATADPDHRVVEDLGDPREFHLVVDPAAPPLVFQFVGDDENGPREVRCFRAGAAEPFQVLDLLHDASETCGDIETPYRGSDFFTAEDLDGDGFNDLRVLAMWGATGTEMFFYYRWDPTRSEFTLGENLGDFGPGHRGCIRRAHAARAVQLR